jgi:hypothetical protein
MYMKDYTMENMKFGGEMIASMLAYLCTGQYGSKARADFHPKLPFQSANGQTSFQSWLAIIRAQMQGLTDWDSRAHNDCVGYPS